MRNVDDYKGDIKEEEDKNWQFFEGLDYKEGHELKSPLKHIQLKEPLFEFSGACAGCGETSYIKLLTQLYGERLLIGNATGCSTIYASNLPTTPYSKTKKGKGVAWANSLFENNAEFVMGITSAQEYKHKRAINFIEENSSHFTNEAVEILLNNKQIKDKEVYEAQAAINIIKKDIEKLKDKKVKERIEEYQEDLLKKVVWAIGGDGWAYDIGFAGIDQALNSGENINILVLDTQGYANTGGQASKATSVGAIAKFANAGKPTNKKDLGMYALSLGGVYVASICMGAKDSQTHSALKEAMEYEGPSIVLAYSPCIEHGYDLSQSVQQSQIAVDTGYWNLYRYNPLKKAQGKKAMKIDSKITKDINELIVSENRFKNLRLETPSNKDKLNKLKTFIEENYNRLENFNK